MTSSAIGRVLSAKTVIPTHAVCKVAGVGFAIRAGQTIN